MKGLTATIVGVALTASLAAAPRVIANENGEVHSYSSQTSMTQPTYVDNDGPMFEPAGTMVHVVGPGMVMTPGSRIYLVNDDPAYDLSGAGDHWFLVGDGTAFQDNHWKNTAAFAATTGPDRPEVVPIFAEYRQDWLAVAAGDRPVRTFNAPPSVMETGTAVVPSSMVYTNPESMDRYTYSSTQYTETPKRKATVRRTHTARYSKARVHHRHRATYTAATRRHHYQATSTVKRHRRTTVTSTYHRPARYSYAETAPASNEGMYTTTVSQRTDETGHQVFQMHSSWYMKNNGDWFRAASWRGPYVKVSKGLVPREVKMSEKHPSRIDMG